MKTTPPQKNLTNLNASLEITETEEGNLVRAVRGEMSYRQFESYLNANIPPGMPGSTTHTMVSNWEKKIHPVTDACLLAWTVFYDKADNRHRLANIIIALRQRPYKKVSPKELDEQDGVNLLEAVKTKNEGEE